MTLLRRQEVEGLLRAYPSLIDGFDDNRLGTQTSPIRGASLDLTIGDIFLPGAADGRLGGSNRGKERHQLKTGETAVVRTAERLQLPGDVAAIGFPPSTRVSLAGLLTTNPGHVDPGYRGPLHLTVINMAKEAFTLERGQRIMRLMLFRLSGAEPALGVPGSPIGEELLSALSPDFLNIQDRVSAAVERAGWRLQARNAWLPLAAAIVTAAGAFILNYWLNVQQTNQEIAKLQAKVDAIGSKVDLGAIDQRLEKLEARFPPSAAPAGTKH
jgi:dCTP deaminase